MYIYTIYKYPLDYPDYYVVRISETKSGQVVPTNNYALGESLEQIRKCVPPGLARFDRHPDDDPVIVETWI